MENPLNYLLVNVSTIDSSCTHFSFVFRLNTNESANFLLATIVSVLQVANVNLLRVGEYTELFVLNCYRSKFSMISKSPISHRNYRYLKYRSLTDIRFFTMLRMTTHSYKNQEIVYC
ncbi:hypothetical protein Hanom_Chr15g01397661 [Helianthus anomalus]